MAERIAASLRARLSPDEKSAIDTRPTADLAAYDLYLRAKDLVERFQETADWRDTLGRAVRLLDDGARWSCGPWRSTRWRSRGCSAALAMICAWTDEPDEAMKQLAVLAKTSGGPDYGQLRFDPT